MLSFLNPHSSLYCPVNQDRFSQAVAHLDKVSARSTHQSLLHCEAELRRGICLEKLGMHSDAREALEGVAHTKAPFPHIRRRAAQELWAQNHAHNHVEATSAQAKEGEIVGGGIPCFDSPVR